jgi:hypothetical protein
MSQKSAKTRARSKPSDAAPAKAAPADDVYASDPAAVHFFSAPPVTYDEYPLEVVDAVPEPGIRRAPANPERRRHLTRVVAGAVALSCAICVAAAVRVATVHAATEGVAPSEVALAAPPAPPAAIETDVPSPASPIAAAAPPLQPDPVPNTPPPVEAPPAIEAPSVAAENAVPTVVPAAGATAQGEAEAPAEVDPVAARDAKRASQRALDRGDAKTSIEAGERSVALDPSDAEAWLILGAAYQTRGTYAEARRCFSSCVHVAKRGPRGECSALMR